MSQFCNHYFARDNTPPGFMLVMSNNHGFCNAYQRSVTGYDYDPQFKTCCADSPVVRVGGCFEWCTMADRYKPANNTCIQGHYPDELFHNCLTENATTAGERGALQVVPCFMPNYQSGAESWQMSLPGSILSGALLVAVMIAFVR